MNAKLRKIAALGEVTLVTFVFVPYLTLGVNRLFPRFAGWQTDTLGFPFPVFVYVVMAGLSLIAIRLRGRKLADYGVQFRELKYQLDIAAPCFIPVVLADVPMGMGLDHTTWSGAIVLAVINMAVLLLLALILRKKIPAPALGTAAVWALLWPSVSGGAQATAGKAIVLFLTYALFVGFGEEMLFRGYMQSRLNETFGKPYRFFEVPFGWGAAITALSFGFMHIGIMHWILGTSTEVALAWGFWTIFAGLVLGFVREKSGGILAPALLHGLPQALASVAMLFIL